jgi:hypothetical protein
MYFGLDLNRRFRDIGIRLLQSQLGEKAICLGAARAIKYPGPINHSENNS